jgi:hypothetical protein
VNMPLWATAPRGHARSMSMHVATANSADLGIFMNSKGKQNASRL